LAARAATPRTFNAFPKTQRPSAVAALDIARLVLEGRAAMLEGRSGAAVEAYRAAARIEEARLDRFRDPPFWWYPVRRSLAAALIAQGRTAEAELELRQVLLWWPYDPMSLRLLADCARPGDATRATLRAQAASNWVGDVDALPAALL
jgi:hypothetical protein